MIDAPFIVSECDKDTLKDTSLMLQSVDSHLKSIGNFCSSKDTSSIPEMTSNMTCISIESWFTFKTGIFHLSIRLSSSMDVLVG